MRYKVRLSYIGEGFAGWQRQENAMTVQEVIEEMLYKRLQEPVTVVGCGRTDAGVHASDFVMHFDTAEAIPDNFIYSLNQLLPTGIAFHAVEAVSADFHARFDAVRRSYVYRIHLRKDPFREGLSYYAPFLEQADRTRMQTVAGILLKYQEFGPFCKAHTDVRTMRCALNRSEWKFDDDQKLIEYHISADRFLRGMVRLIVGACIQVGLGKMTIEEITAAMDRQQSIPRPWSVPPEGLYLSQVVYP